MTLVTMLVYPNRFLAMGCRLLEEEAGEEEDEKLRVIFLGSFEVLGGLKVCTEKGGKNTIFLGSFGSSPVMISLRDVSPSA